VDRIVLNAVFPLGHSLAGFRFWWRRWHDGTDDNLDNTHLMRLAGRFARRVKAWGLANDVPVIFCTGRQHKHLIAEAYRAAHAITRPGVFLVPVARPPATVFKVSRSALPVARRRECRELRAPVTPPEKDIGWPDILYLDHQMALCALGGQEGMAQKGTTN